jgi:hypothetical protein
VLVTTHLLDYLFETMQPTPPQPFVNSDGMMVPVVYLEAYGRYVGHCFFALVMGFVGGAVARHFHLLRSAQ